jgi:transposase
MSKLGGNHKFHYFSKMETKDIIKHILPKEFIDFFELQTIKEKENQLIIYLDEKFILPPEHSDKDLESKGFTAAINLHDYPIRDHQVLLHVRRRKWREKSTGKTYTRNWDIKHEGTSYTKEFAAFLKKMYGQQSS